MLEIMNRSTTSNLIEIVWPVSQFIEVVIVVS